ncbi:MAG: septum site-determining protein MinD [Firmicutes bacterium]|nr:septum site-determining protein MinD [Bacillota bacterium]
MGRCIAFVSGKGGVGKTSIVATAGAVLAYSGKRVCVVDADFGLNNLDIVLGLESKVIFDIIDCMNGKCRVNQALINHPHNKNLVLMPAKNGARCSGKTDIFSGIISYLATNFDYVLIDGPAGIGSGFNRAVSASNEIIVVTTPHISALRDADKVLGILKNYSAGVLGAVINMARGDYIAEKKMLGACEIEKILNCNVIGVVQSNDALFDLSSKTLECVLGERFIEIKNFCCNLEFGTKKLSDIAKRYKGLIGYFRRKRRRAV